jgi:hypothetical protein
VVKQMLATGTVEDVVKDPDTGEAILKKGQVQKTVRPLTAEERAAYEQDLKVYDGVLNQYNGVITKLGGKPMSLGGAESAGPGQTSRETQAVLNTLRNYKGTPLEAMIRESKRKGHTDAQVYAGLKAQGIVQ